MPAAYLAVAIALAVVSAHVRDVAAQVSQPPRAPARPLTATLPLDAGIRAGTLPNGLTYFLRDNPRPNNRVMLRLAVKAGSNDEADDQRGLAHLLEHMAFNGSARFKEGELVSYLESIGAAFGPHVNAYTSFDETVYMLNVPTERPGTLDRGFEALSDFAGGMALATDAIDRERGVVIEEWRGRLGASTRMQEPQLKALFGDSRYVNRLPIGTPEILKSFPPQRLRDFYNDFYRADRMAVVVVGDIRHDDAEALVRKYFGALPSRPPATRVAADIPGHKETRYVTVSDREAQSSTVSLYIKRPLVQLVTVGDYRASIVRGLAFQMINARLGEIARQPDAPFLGASVGDDGVGRTVEAFTAGARVRDGAIPQGLEALTRELQRVRQFGFGPAEFDRAKRSTLASYEQAFAERDKIQSVPLADELVRHFLENEAAPGIEVEVQLIRQFLDTVTAQEVATLARDLIRDDNRVVIASAPEKEGLAPVTPTALAGALTAGLSASVTAWRDESAVETLMATLPAPGKVTARREIPEIGVTVLTLSNGVEVWLKPTDFRNDQIVMTSYAKGGLSVAPPADYFNASLSTGLVSLAGIGGHTPVDIGKVLAGKVASGSAYISSTTHGVQMTTNPRDLETALQLGYLQVTAPNTDVAAAFDLMKRRLEANLANQAQSPGAVFSERVRRVNTMDHYTAKPLRVEDIAGLSSQRMLAFYRERFANAADFTYFIVGAFTVDGITPLLERYVASLPSTGTATSTLGELKLQFPTASVREPVFKGQEPRSQTVISFFADTGLDELEVHRLNAATNVLEIRLRDTLREKLGGTYSVGVGYSNTSPIPGYGTVSVQFGSSPENQETLSQAVMAEVDRMRREGPSAADVAAVKQQEKNAIDESMRQNNYWLGSLQSMHVLGRDPRRILQRVERADSLTTANIHEMFKKYFPANRHTIITLMPEAGAKR
jgi:zinc protease